MRLILIMSFIIGTESLSQSGTLRNPADYASQLAFYGFGNRCESFDEKLARRALQFREKSCSDNDSNKLIPQARQLEKVRARLEGSALDQFFGKLGEQQALELACSTSFAVDISRGNSKIMTELRKLTKSIRTAKQSMLSANRDLQMSEYSKVCPQDINDIGTPPPGGEEWAATCTKLIQSRSLYLAEVASIPLAQADGVKQMSDLIQNYAALPEGKETAEFESGLEQAMKTSYAKAAEQIHEQDSKLRGILLESGGAGIQRDERKILFGDPRLVANLVERSGNDPDLKGLVCSADAQYGKGAHALETSIFIGSFALGPVSKIAIAGGVKALETTNAIWAARALGSISLNAGQLMQAASFAFKVGTSLNALDDACLPSTKLSAYARNSVEGNRCSSAPNLEIVQDQNCRIAALAEMVGMAFQNKSIRRFSGSLATGAAKTGKSETRQYNKAGDFDVTKCNSSADDQDPRCRTLKVEQ